MRDPQPPSIIHGAGMFLGAFSNELKARYRRPPVFLSRAPTLASTAEDVKLKNRNHSAGQCHAAPAHTSAYAHSQPAMPQMISLLFMCKSGAAGVAQMILLLDF